MLLIPGFRVFLRTTLRTVPLPQGREGFPARCWDPRGSGLGLTTPRRQ